MKEEQAKINAKELKRIMGKGWKIRVWNNVGWHYEVNQGCFSISVHNGTYLCMMNDDIKDSSCGASYLDHFTDIDPKKAFLKTIKSARKFFDNWQRIIKLSDKISKEIN